MKENYCMIQFIRNTAAIVFFALIIYSLSACGNPTSENSGGLSKNSSTQSGSWSTPAWSSKMKTTEYESNSAYTDDWESYDILSEKVKYSLSIPEDWIVSGSTAVFEDKKVLEFLPTVLLKAGQNLPEQIQPVDNVNGSEVSVLEQGSDTINQYDVFHIRYCIGELQIHRYHISDREKVAGISFYASDNFTPTQRNVIRTVIESFRFS